MKLYRYVILLLMFSIPMVALGDISLPSIIGEGMVLQRNAEIRIWGWADPQEKVEVILGENTAHAVTNDQGHWSLSLSAMEAGGPYKMVFRGQNTIELKNIMIGEVWICGGQSNMDWPVRLSNNAEAEMAHAQFPEIRLFTVARKVRVQPQDNCEGSWNVCIPETVGNFSAVGYFFGRQLHQKLNVPVGLINSCLGGTRAEAWTDREYLARNPSLSSIFDKYEKIQQEWPSVCEEYGRKVSLWVQDYDLASSKDGAIPTPPAQPFGPHHHQNTVSGLYNAMIAPLIPYTIKGVIWYQGESNTDSAYQYKTLLPTMIQNWRDKWRQGEFPFLIVQLANFGQKVSQPGPCGWAELRAAQFYVSQTVKNAGLAVAIDLGVADDVHPRNKQEVGHRLALIAEATVYGENIIYSGPIYRSMKIDGSKVRLEFDHVGSGLITNDSAPLSGFSIAGEDQTFKWAEAEIEGDEIIVWNNEIVDPVAVRYGWEINPDCNLYNKEGLPASPFCSDNWKWLTDR